MKQKSIIWGLSTTDKCGHAICAYWLGALSTPNRGPMLRSAFVSIPRHFRSTTEVFFSDPPSHRLIFPALYFDRENHCKWRRKHRAMGRTKRWAANFYFSDCCHGRNYFYPEKLNLIEWSRFFFFPRNWKRLTDFYEKVWPQSIWRQNFLRFGFNRPRPSIPKKQFPFGAIKKLIYHRKEAFRFCGIFSYPPKMRLDMEDVEETDVQKHPNPQRWTCPLEEAGGRRCERK